jgi:mRNA interferase RelE/StbE
MATVTFTPEAAEQADELPKRVRARLLALIDRLEKWPDVSGAKPLRGDLAGFYRLRTGDYRLQFRVEGDNVIVVKVGHRDRFYED